MFCAHSPDVPGGTFRWLPSIPLGRAMSGGVGAAIAGPVQTGSSAQRRRRMRAVNAMLRWSMTTKSASSVKMSASVASSAAQLTSLSSSARPVLQHSPLRAGKPAPVPQLHPLPSPRNVFQQTPCSGPNPTVAGSTCDLCTRGLLTLALAANQGHRPVAEIQFADYIFPAFDQITNEAAKTRFGLEGGPGPSILLHSVLRHYFVAFEAFSIFGCVRSQFNAGVNDPLTTGRGHGGLYHSQSSEVSCTTPGLKVVVP